MGLMQKYGVGSLGGGGGAMFSNVALSSAVAISPLAGSLTRIDGATAAADVVVTLPVIANVGAVVGIFLATADGVHSVTLVNGPADALPLWTPGDWLLLVWDGAAWVLCGYDIAPGFLTDLGAGSLVAAYRFYSKTNFVTDYSGNARTLSALGAVTTGQGVGASQSSLRTTAGIGSSTSAGFRMLGVMSCMVLYFGTSTAPVNQTILACGVPGAANATNVLWSMGTGAGGALQYFAESGAGSDIVFGGANASVLPIGWVVVGMTRSAGQVVKFYYNGVLVDTSAALTAPTDGGSSNLGVASYSTAGFPLNGHLLAQAGIWSVELSAAQMLRGAKQLLGAHA
jgi:hypothetical protein